MVLFPYSVIPGLHSAQGQGQTSNVARHHIAWPLPHHCFPPCSRGGRGHGGADRYNAGPFAVTIYIGGQPGGRTDERQEAHHIVGLSVERPRSD